MAGGRRRVAKVAIRRNARLTWDGVRKVWRFVVLRVLWWDHVPQLHAEEHAEAHDADAGWDGEIRPGGGEVFK